MARTVDVYAKPGGEGKPVGEPLGAGSTVTLLVEREDHWCQVEGSAVPGGEGWVWCGVGEDGESYELMATGAGTGMENGGAPAGQPVKYDCKDYGPNEGAGGGAADPKVKFECEALGDGNKRCCWVKYP